MKNASIIRVSLDEATKRPGNSDWTRIEATTDVDIDRHVAEDPDLQGVETVDWSQATFVPAPAKQAISIRLDADVLNFFKEQGGGYQSRINRVLRHYMESVKKAG